MSTPIKRLPVAGSERTPLEGAREDRSSESQRKR